MGSGVEAGQAEGRETSSQATAVIRQKSDEGMSHSSDGGHALER